MPLQQITEDEKTSALLNDVVKFGRYLETKKTFVSEKLGVTGHKKGINEPSLNPTANCQITETFQYCRSCCQKFRQQDRRVLYLSCTRPEAGDGSYISDSDCTRGHDKEPTRRHFRLRSRLIGLKKVATQMAEG